MYRISQQIFSVFAKLQLSATPLLFCNHFQARQHCNTIQYRKKKKNGKKEKKKKKKDKRGNEKEYLQPINLPNPVIMLLPHFAPISKKLSLSITSAMSFRMSNVCVLSRGTIDKSSCSLLLAASVFDCQLFLFILIDFQIIDFQIKDFYIFDCRFSILDF